MPSPSPARWLLSASGIIILFYCVFVLGFVGTSPDLGMRFLLVDPVPAQGPIIQATTASLQHKGGAKPQTGDVLLAVGPSHQPQRRLQPVGTFMHFTRSLVNLRGETPFDGKLLAGSDVSEHEERIPPFAEIESSRLFHRERWVEIQYWRPSEARVIRTWLRVNSLPLGEILLSFVWFLLELGIFSVGALAFWTRPFDRQARVFFAMCVVTAGAFVGGYHWWVIAGSLWLNIPFCICAVLVPVVTLHFFLIYPQPKLPIVRYPRATLVALYAVPLVFVAVLVTLLCQLSWQYAADVPTPVMLGGMVTLRLWICTYLVIASFYFLATLWALGNSFLFTRDPIEQSQVKWILWAAVIATVPVGYTLYLTQFQRVEFAIGVATWPMFIASLLFMLAYAVGIVRYKLMLINQLFSREVLYFVVSLAATGVYSLTIALGSLIGIFQQVRSSRDALVVAATVMVGVIMLAWLRDRFQRIIDRRFFREKYQLDKALQRMSPSAAQLVEPAQLARRLLSSCQDGLLVDRSALFLHEAGRNQFRLVASERGGGRQFPGELPVDGGLLKILAHTATLQRANPSGRERMSSVQTLLRETDSFILHALESDGTVAGVVLLGAKNNGGTYSAEDLTFLTAMGQVTSVALHSARVHARMQDDLQGKVDKIAEQQRQISLLQTELISKQEGAAPRAPDSFRRDSIKGSSPATKLVLETVRKVSDSQSSVLIRGESGTGKELLAQALHENSPRRDGPLIRVHCGALAPGVLESELFGHVKGAFTGAHQNKIGRFEMAHGGSLFLDEIGDISLETQIKLLRVLQERSFEPVGGTRTMQVDVRLIAATHQNLEKQIAQGRFREDLFYRLNVISITLPPLRERREDIFELALHFLTRTSERVGKRMTHIEEDALEALQRHQWPGNIRELENAIERAVVLSDGESIALANLPPEIWQPANTPASAPLEPKPGSWNNGENPGEARPFAGSAEDLAAERAQLLAALQQTGGNKARAARLLGMPRSTFFSKLKKFSLDG